MNDQGSAGFTQIRSRNTSLNPTQRRNCSDETIDRETEADREADNQDEIVMAVDMRGRSTIGCVYYVSRDEILYFMEDSKLGDASIIDSCQASSRKNDSERLILSLVKLHIEPTVILVPTKIDDEIFDRLDPGRGRRASTADGESLYIFLLSLSDN
jgi:DNA mismatch repair protein MSH5